MSVSAQLVMKMSVTETLETSVAGNEALGSTNQTVIHDGFNLASTLVAGSTVPATKVCAFTQALTAGAAEIDLKACPTTNGDLVDLDGLKIQAIMIRGKSSNANPITFQPDTGGTDDYELMGADFKVIVEPGQQLMFFGNEAAPAVDATNKIFSLAGTDEQELDVIIVAG